jgi:hypothetical protein
MKLGEQVRWYDSLLERAGFEVSVPQRRFPSSVNGNTRGWKEQSREELAVPYVGNGCSSQSPLAAFSAILQPRLGCLEMDLAS